jgi:hypothetical protein
MYDNNPYYDDNCFKMKKRTFWKEVVSIYSWKEIKKGLIIISLVFGIIILFYYLKLIGMLK